MDTHRNGQSVAQCDSCWKIIQHNETTEVHRVQGRRHHCCETCRQDPVKRTKAFAEIPVVPPDEVVKQQIAAKHSLDLEVTKSAAPAREEN